LVAEELAPLYDKVTLYCSNEIAGEWKCRDSKTIFRAWPNEFWVKQKKFSSYSSDPWNLEEFLKYLAVGFKQTHVVSILKPMAHCISNALAVGMNKMDTFVNAFVLLPMRLQSLLRWLFVGTSHTMFCT
jgi:hypothetical protein